MAEKKILLTNKLKQGLPILLTDGKGKMRSWIIPSRGTREIAESELSQDVIDKESRGFITRTFLGAKK